MKRPIPVWLLEDDAFLEQVDDWVEQWGQDRSNGFRGLIEYTGAIHAMAQDHIANRIVKARTPEHKTRGRPCNAKYTSTGTDK